MPAVNASSSPIQKSAHTTHNSGLGNTSRETLASRLSKDKITSTTKVTTATKTVDVNLREAPVNGLSPSRLIALFDESQKILDDNKVTREIEGETYNGTMPSKDFYVHQWCWDSATHAMGLAETHPTRALDELASLCLGQWDNGMIPQIQFFEESDNKIYFPGADCWGTQAQSPKGIETSGITQPPILGLAAPKVALAVLQTLPSKPEQRTPKQQKTFEKLSKVLDSAFKYCQFLKNDRDPENSGLTTVVHPWESGLDNAPQWDEPLAHKTFKLENIPAHVQELVDTHRKDVNNPNKNKKDNTDERPEQKKYYDYMSLVDQFKGMAWDQREMALKSNFRVKDVLFSSIFVAGCDDLAEFYHSDTAKRFNLADAEKASALEQWANTGRAGLEQTWNDDLNRYLCQNLKQKTNTGHHGKPIETDTLSGFSPLLAGLGNNKARTEKLLAALQDPQTYNTEFSVPTAAKNSPSFELKRYWRGCVWPITNFLTMQALQKVSSQHPGTALASQAEEISQRLKSQLNQLIDNVGFQEYYMPTKKMEEQEKIGFGKFSWTAAVFLMNNAGAYRHLTNKTE